MKPSSSTVPGQPPGPPARRKRPFLEQVTRLLAALAALMGALATALGPATTAAICRRLFGP
jgi:hypothetical protein